MCMRYDLVSTDAHATAQQVLDIPTALEKMLFCNFNAITLSLLIE